MDFSTDYCTKIDVQGLIPIAVGTPDHPALVLGIHKRLGEGDEDIQRVSCIVELRELCLLSTLESRTRANRVS